MAINFPTTLDTFSNPIGTDLLENATTALDHDVQHSNANDAIEALEAKVGVDGSAVTTSHDYKLSGVATGDKAVSKTGTETLTNKTLTAPQINMGSDAAGDMYYRSLAGTFSRLPLGTTGQILNVDGSGIPAWIANPAAADASTTVKGVVEIATTAQITAGTGAGETGALLVVPASAVGAVGASKIVQFNASTQYPAADGSLITNITNPAIYKNGSTTYNLATASGNQTIAHGLGKAPKYIRITVIQASTSGASDNYSFGVYNGTTNSSVYRGQNSNSQFYVGTDATYCVNIYTAATNDTSPSTATATFDATNITLAWTRATSATGTAQILWEAYA